MWRHPEILPLYFQGWSGHRGWAWEGSRYLQFAGWCCARKRSMPAAWKRCDREREGPADRWLSIPALPTRRWSGFAESPPPAARENVAGWSSHLAALVRRHLSTLYRWRPGWHKSLRSAAPPAWDFAWCAGNRSRFPCSCRGRTNRAAQLCPVRVWSRRHSRPSLDSRIRFRA